MKQKQSKAQKEIFLLSKVFKKARKNLAHLRTTFSKNTLHRLLPLPKSLVTPISILQQSIRRIALKTCQELAFYKQQGIPLPRRSPAQRHIDRDTLRNPRKLWTRECAKCQKAIATSYDPNRPEIVYCESCYLPSIK